MMFYLYVVLYHEMLHGNKNNLLLSIDKIKKLNIIVTNSDR